MTSGEILRLISLIDQRRNWIAKLESWGYQRQPTIPPQGRKDQFSYNLMLEDERLSGLVSLYVRVAYRKLDTLKNSC